MSFRPAHPVQNLVDRYQIEFFSMDRIACPFPIVFKFLVPRLEDHLQELLVS